MTVAENIIELWIGGYKDQAQRMAEAESLAVVDDQNALTRTYEFADGSSCWIGGGDAALIDETELAWIEMTRCMAAEKSARDEYDRLENS